MRFAIYCIHPYIYFALYSNHKYTWVSSRACSDWHISCLSGWLNIDSLYRRSIFANSINSITYHKRAASHLTINLNRKIKIEVQVATISYCLRYNSWNNLQLFLKHINSLLPSTLWSRDHMTAASSSHLKLFPTSPKDRMNPNKRHHASQLHDRF